MFGSNISFFYAHTLTNTITATVLQLYDLRLLHPECYAATKKESMKNLLRKLGCPEEAIESILMPFSKELEENNETS